MYPPQIMNPFQGGDVELEDFDEAFPMQIKLEKEVDEAFSYEEDEPVSTNPFGEYTSINCVP